MQENKYFTPEIEDIRVGYECEINKSLFNGISEGWHNFIFKEFEQLEVINKRGLKGFRVPYLTKNQIETEGWEDITTDIHEELWWGMSKFKKEGYELFYDYINHLISINSCEEDNEYPRIIHCKCKDINNFRYICKLLEINS